MLEIMRNFLLRYSGSYRYKILMSYNVSDLQKLKILRRYGPWNRTSGICGNVKFENSVFIHRMMQLWPESYKGMGQFPIGGRKEFVLPGLWEGERGEKRYRLIDYLIEKLS